MILDSESCQSQSVQHGAILIIPMWNEIAAVQCSILISISQSVVFVGCVFIRSLLLKFHFPEIMECLTFYLSTFAFIIVTSGKWQNGLNVCCNLILYK